MNHDNTIAAIRSGVAGFTAWASSVGFSWVLFDEWSKRVSIVVGIIVGVLTIISITKRLWPKK